MLSKPALRLGLGEDGSARRRKIGRERLKHQKPPFAEAFSALSETALRRRSPDTERSFVAIECFEADATALQDETTELAPVEHGEHCQRGHDAAPTSLL